MQKDSRSSSFEPIARQMAAQLLYVDMLTSKYATDFEICAPPFACKAPA